MRISYTVQPGDSLSTIAEYFLGDLMRYDEIAALNSISNPNLISVGQVLAIDTDEAAPQAPAYLSPGGVPARLQDFSLRSLVPGLALPTVSAQPLVKPTTPVAASVPATSPKSVVPVSPNVTPSIFAGISSAQIKQIAMIVGAAGAVILLLNIMKKKKSLVTAKNPKKIKSFNDVTILSVIKEANYKDYHYEIHSMSDGTIKVEIWQPKSGFQLGDRIFGPYKSLSEANTKLKEIIDNHLNAN